jgi:hypothetical protein
MQCKQAPFIQFIQFFFRRWKFFMSFQHCKHFQALNSYIFQWYNDTSLFIAPLSLSLSRCSVENSINVEMINGNISRREERDKSLAKIWWAIVNEINFVCNVVKGEFFDIVIRWKFLWNGRREIRDLNIFLYKW